MYRKKPNHVSALKQSFQFALILVFLSAFFGVSPVTNIEARGANPAPAVDTTLMAPSFAPVAGVALNVPTSIQIGENFSFTATFDNTSATDVGYGPFIDVYFPVTGADGAGAAIDDGIDFASASFLGGSITTVVQSFPAGPLGGPCLASQSRVNHPYAVAFSTGLPLVVCGTPGDKLVTIQLPFGSFTPAQTPAVITLNATLSNFADAGTSLSLRARGGYQYGSTPLNDWCCVEGSIVSHPPDSSSWPPSSVTPTLLSLSKMYNGPEDETSTGPNYTRQYALAVDIATGQPLTTLTVTDTFPNNMQFVSVASTVPAATCTTVPSPLSAPGGTLSCDFGSVTGGAGTDATVVINFYIPLNDAGGFPVINAADGDDAASDNASGASGNWTPVDSRDSITAVTASAVCPTNCPGLNDRSIAIQKSAATFTDVGVTGNSPGDTLEYTLAFQISDFFSFQDVVLTDVLSDGQRVDLTFTPTLQVNGNGYTLAALGMDAANYTIDNSEIDLTDGPPPAPENPATDGTQTITFRASDELVTRLQPGKWIGGCVPVAGTGGPVPSCSSYNNGATTGTITFRAIIQDQFTDTYPSGDSSVDHGDVLGNDVTITGDLLSVANNSTLTTFSEADTSSARLSIAFGTLVKSLYAINGTLCPDAVVCPGSGPYEIKPGDLVTYRLQYGQPSSDFEQTILTDYLPLPVYRVGDPDANGAAGPAWTQDGVSGAVPPAAGQWKYGPADSTHLRPGAPTPTTAISVTNNTLAFTYAPYDDPTNTTSAIDLLFTVTTTSEPFTDRLFLTNQLTVDEGTTNAGSQTLNTIVQVILTEPVLTTKKGIVESSDDPANGGDAVYNPVLPASPDFTEPGSAGLRFTTPILSSSGAGNSNISNVDAGDLVTFVIFVENSGSSVKGAFDIRIRDILMPGYVIPGSGPGLNLDVRRGDGSAVGFTNIGAGLFDPAGGIEITDPGLAQGACENGAVGNGRNVLVITYDLQVDTSFPGGTIINTGTLFNYAGSEGGPNHLSSPLTDTASTTIISAPVKSIITTSEVDTSDSGAGTTADPRLATIGEIVRYRISVQVPEGTSPNLRIRDNIPAGMSFLDDTNTVSMAFVSDGGTCGQNISSSTLGSSPGSCGSSILAPTFFLNFGNATADQTVSATDSTVIASYSADDNDTYNNGTDVYFKFGDITNADRDFNNEYIVIEFNVLVRNEAGNVTGTNLDNTSIYRTGSSTTNSTASNTTRARVVEPLITFGKTIVSAPTPLDAGGLVTYRITVANGSGTNVSTAYDLAVSDILPNALTLNALPGSVVVTTLTGTVGAVDVLTNTAINSPPTTPSRLDVRIAALAPNSSVQIDYTATINSSVTPAEIINNTGNGTWTSLPGSGTSPNSTGSVAGTAGSATGERNGSGGVNNYTRSASQNFTSSPVAITKQITATSFPYTTGTDVTIGEEITYVILLAFPEGTTPADTVVDQLPSGLEMVSGTPEVINTAAGSGGLLTADFSGTIGTQTITEVSGDGGSVTFNFANIAVPADNNTANDTLMLRFRARVTNNASILAGGTISNSATNQVGTGTPLRSNIVDVRLRDFVKTIGTTNISSTGFNPTDNVEEVTIGEIVTYQIALTVPQNSTDTAIITDTLDSGLAFVDCSQMIAGSNITSSRVNFTSSGNCTPGTVIGSNPLISNTGHTISFDLGTITNGGSTAQTIILTYRVVVLNIASNLQNVVLNNNVVLTNNAGTVNRQGVPSLRIVQPQLQIVKTVDPVVAALGSVVTYSIDISHASQSLATAYDVRLTDGIPTGLALVPGSVVINGYGSAPPPPTTVRIFENPTQFTVYWSEFPLGQTATVTFQATYVGPDAVFNTANVEWKSIQIDPVPPIGPGSLPAASAPFSAFNALSTERRFSPVNLAVDNYSASSSVRLSIPQRLPRTGFAPGKTTILPQQPEDFAYTALGGLWLEIPKLGVKVDIVGVPIGQEDWNLTWLGDKAGYLDGTAYPTHNGNTGITAHAYLADGTPGPFVNLDKMSYGDQVIVYLGGQKYIYEVREEKLVRPESVSSALKHEELPWLTLITCKTYSEATKDYVYRTVVRAVLVDVIPE